MGCSGRMLAAAGTPEQPVVLLEVQMHSKQGFRHRLWAQTARFVQLHPQVQHLAVVVVVPHRRLKLGPARLPQQLQSFLDGVHWLSLDELGHQSGLHPLVSLLTLPVLPRPEIPGATEQILQPRPDLLDTVVTILVERFPHLTREEIMALIKLPTGHLRHTRAVQEWRAAWRGEGRLEGEARGEARGRAAEAAAMAIRQLNHRCGPLSEATTARIKALPLDQLDQAVDTLAIQRSLTILEDRYRELREIGEKHRQAWEAEETNLRANLAEVVNVEERRKDWRGS
jgi:predicted transposase YdaD